MTDGTSAQLTNQFAPDATVRASVHPLSVRSEKRKVAFSPERSTQLSTTRSPSEESCGWALWGAAGDVNAITVRGQPASVETAGDWPATDTITNVRIPSNRAAACFTHNLHPS